MWLHVFFFYFVFIARQMYTPRCRNTFHFKMIIGRCVCVSVFFYGLEVLPRWNYSIYGRPFRFSVVNVLQLCYLHRTQIHDIYIYMTLISSDFVVSFCACQTVMIPRKKKYVAKNVRTTIKCIFSSFLLQTSRAKMRYRFSSGWRENNNIMYATLYHMILSIIVFAQFDLETTLFTFFFCFADCVGKFNTALLATILCKW